MDRKKKKKKEGGCLGLEGQFVSMDPSELFDPLVNETFDLIPQGSKH